MKEEKTFHRRPSLQSKKTNLTNFTSYFLKTPLDDIVLGTIDLSIFLSIRLNVKFFNEPYFWPIDFKY